MVTLYKYKDWKLYITNANICHTLVHNNNLVDYCKKVSECVMSRQRCFWGVAVHKSGDECQLVILYKDARGGVSRFSKSPKGSSVKVPYGPPDSCSFGSETKDGSSELFFR